MKSIDQGYIQSDLISDTYKVDDNWLNFSGYRRSELPLSLSELTKKILHPEDFERITTSIKKANDSNSTDNFSNDFRFRHANGHWMWVRSSIQVIRDSSGKPTTLLAKQVDISEHKTTEQILRTSQVLAGLRECIFEDDVISLTTVKPGKVGVMLPDEWYQVAIIDSIHPDDLQRVLETFHQAELSNQSFEIEFRIFSRDHTALHILLFAQPETDDKGKFIRIRGVFRDITEKKLSESRQDTYRILIEGSRTGLIISRASDLAVLHVNQKYCDDTGFSLEEALTLSTEDLLTDWDYEQIKNLFSGLLNDPERRNKWTYQSGNLCHKNGSSITVDGWTQATEWEGEIAFATVALDVSEQKKTQQALSDSEEKYRQLFDALPDSVVLFDEDSTIIDCNQEMARSHGWSREELIGKPLALISPAPAELNIIETLKQHGELVAQGIERHRDGTENMVESHAKVISIRDQIIMVAVLRDIAERNRFIEEIQRQKAEMEEFTYTVSHDLKSPLTTISGFSEVLAESLEDNDIEAAKADLQRISRAASKMQDLLGELLEYSRLGVKPNNIESAPMVEIIDDALDRVAGQILESSAIITVQPDQPTVEGNLTRLVQVYQNLIDNAIKFHHRERHVEIELGWNSEQACFFVDDNGPGIESQFKEKIFGLFDQLDQDRSGTGIGLAAAKKIIETHGGTIWMESPSPLGGTRFNFTLQRPSKRGR
ncbi:MAG: PAS domain S-box protein [Immundisolibacteraceae bacterium]|nr:PAS domain S-box protein [Immundisolibacteraceae bacterium]